MNNKKDKNTADDSKVKLIMQKGTTIANVINTYATIKTK